MVIASTSGDPSLEVIKRHMRRTPQPRGMEMRRDALLVEGDLLKAYQTLSRPDANDYLNEKEGQAAPKKKRKKRKKEKIIPPPAPSANGSTPNKVTPARVIAIGVSVAEASSICFRDARGRNRVLRDGCLWRWIIQKRLVGMYPGVRSTPRLLAWDCALAALCVTAPSALIRERRPTWSV